MAEKPKSEAKKGNSAAWRNWYERHREEHNERRRLQYAADAEKRRKILERQQEQRRTHPKPAADGRHFKKIGGANVQVFRVGDVAELIGKDIQSIRIWERSALIPKPTIPGGHRYYTQGQMELIKQLSDLMTEVRYDVARRTTEIPALAIAIKAQWANA